MAEINDIDLKLNILADDKATNVLKSLSSTLDGLRSTLASFKDANPFTQIMVDATDVSDMVRGLQTDIKGLQTAFDGLASSPGLMAVRETLAQVSHEVAVTEGDAKRNPFADWQLGELQKGLQSSLSDISRIDTQADNSPFLQWLSDITEIQDRLATVYELMQRTGAGPTSSGGAGATSSKSGAIPLWMKGVNGAGNLLSELPMKMLYGGMNAMMGYYGLQAIANSTGNFESIRQIQSQNNMSVNQAAQAYAMMGAAGLNGTAGASFLSGFEGSMQQLFTPMAGSGYSKQAILLASLLNPASMKNGKLTMGDAQQYMAQSPWMLLNTVAGRYQSLLGSGRGQQAAELLNLTGTTQFAGAFQNWGGLQKQMSGINLGMNTNQLQNVVNENITLQGQMQKLSIAFSQLAAAISPTVIKFVQALTDLASGLAGTNGQQGVGGAIKGAGQAANTLGPGWTTLFAGMAGIKAIQWEAAARGGLSKALGAGARTGAGITATEGAGMELGAGALGLPFMLGMGLIPWNTQDVNSIPSRLKQANDTSLYQYGRFGPGFNNTTSSTGFWSSIHKGFTDLGNWSSKAGHDLSNWSINAGDHIRNFADISSNDITGWTAQGKAHLFNWATNTEARISDWSSNAKHHIQSFASNTRTSFDNWSTHLQAWASNLWPRVTSDFNSWRTHLSSWAANLWPSVIKDLSDWNKHLSLWGAGLWGSVESDFNSWYTHLTKWSGGLWGSVQNDFNLFTSELDNWASNLWGTVSHWFSGLFGGGGSSSPTLSSTPTGAHVTSGATGYASTSTLQSWVNKAIGIAKAPVSWAGDLMKMIQNESGGNSSLVNQTGVNYGGGHGVEYATGLMQMMPTTFSAYAAKGMTNITNPIDNLVSSINYIRSKYLSPANIPGIGTSGTYKGYASGGMISEPIVGIGMNSGTNYTFGEMGPEYIMPMNRGAGRVAGGGQVFNVTINVPGMVGASQVRDIARQVATEFVNGVKRRGNFDMG